MHSFCCPTQKLVVAEGPSPEAAPSFFLLSSHFLLHRHFALQTFCPTDILPHQHFALPTFCPTKFLPTGILAKKKLAKKQNIKKTKLKKKFYSFFLFFFFVALLFFCSSYFLLLFNFFLIDFLPHRLFAPQTFCQNLVSFSTLSQDWLIFENNIIHSPYSEILEVCLGAVPGV